jgi:hypothetical protein
VAALSNKLHNIKKMNRIINLFLLCFIFSTSEAQLVVDAHAEARGLTGSFQKIIIAGNIKLIISPSFDIAMAVSADEEKYIDEIKTMVEENTLLISLGDSKLWKNKKKGYTVYLSVKNLSAIEATGAADIIVAGNLQAENILINLSGASSFKGTLIATDVKTELKGASEAKLKGSTVNFLINCSGASDLNAYDLITEHCVANAAGASDIQLTAQKTLAPTASGASHIFYRGNAVVSGLSAHGASKIVNKN